MNETSNTDTSSVEQNLNNPVDQQTSGDMHHADSQYVIDYGNHTTVTNVCCSTCACKGDDSTGCDVLNTILSNPAWGWILIVAIAIFIVFRNRLIRMLDIHSKRIESSKACSGKIGPLEYSYSQVDEADSDAFEQKDGESQAETSAEDTSTGETSAASEYYYPAFEDILGNATANKILSTLWKYQKDYGLGNDNVKRWSFAVNEESFHNVARKLHWSGLIIANGSMYMLSNVGIRCCRKYEAKLHMECLYGPFVKGR